MERETSTHQQDITKLLDSVNITSYTKCCIIHPLICINTIHHANYKHANHGCIEKRGWLFSLWWRLTEMMFLNLQTRGWICPDWSADGEISSQALSWRLWERNSLPSLIRLWKKQEKPIMMRNGRFECPQIPSACPRLMSVNL